MGGKVNCHEKPLYHPLCADDSIAPTGVGNDPIEVKLINMKDCEVYSFPVLMMA